MENRLAALELDSPDAVATPAEAALSAEIVNFEAEINSWHEELCRLHDSALPLALKIGQALAQKRSELGHGQYGRWVNAHLTFSRRTANNYLRIFRGQETLLREGVVSLDAAYRRLCPSYSRSGEKICHLTETQQGDIETYVAELASALRHSCGEFYREAVVFAIAELRDLRNDNSEA